jgi:hypothetical protein
MPGTDTIPFVVLDFPLVPKRTFVIKVRKQFETFDEAAGFMPHIVTSENINEFEIVMMNTVELVTNDI